ncbi:MAG: hypothetical protein K6G17_03265 [Oscillospiraceae bacterium]|nr:hypothetical protein [Oscillospiraceae bacterium]
MKRKILITGPAGDGKAELIRSALGGRLAEAGGYIIRVERNRDGFAERYCLLPAAAAGGVEGYEGETVLDASSWPPAHYTEAYRETGARLLREALFYPFAVAEELGGFELLVPQFRTALCELLDSGLPLLATLKTPEESEQWRTLFALGDRFTGKVEELHRRLRSDPELEILDSSLLSDAAIREKLALWSKKWL